MVFLLCVAVVPGHATAGSRSRPSGVATGGWHGRLTQRNTNTRIHDDDERQRRQVDVGEEHRGVDLTHLLIGPVLAAPIKGAGLIGVAVAKQDGDSVLPCDLEYGTVE